MQISPPWPTPGAAYERATRRPGARRLRAGARPRRAASPRTRTLFHAPSFSAGLVMGALVVLGFAYYPEFRAAEADAAGAAGAAAPAGSDSRPQLTFEFDDLLRNSEVIADPEPYRSPAPPQPAATAGLPAGTGAQQAATVSPAPATATGAPASSTAAGGERPATAAAPAYLLQAASFRSRDDAERLRAALLLMDLPSSTQSIALDSGVWYRVTVGPFDTETAAQRAMTRLREKNIAAIWARR